MRRHRPPERPSAAGIRIKSPRARFDRLSGRISGTRTDTPPSGSSPRRRKATQRGLSKRPRFTQIRGRFFAPEFPAAQVRHPLIPPGTARLLPTPSAPQVAIQSPRYRRSQFRARRASSRTKPAAPQVAPKPSAPQVAPSPRRLKSHQAHGASSRTKAHGASSRTKARSASSRAKARSAAGPTLFPCAAGRTKALRTAGPPLFPAPQVATPS